MELIVVLLIAGAAVAAVLIPLVRRGPAHDPSLDDGPARPRRQRDPAETEALIARYRQALRDGTVCRRCGRANPAGSRYCAECGRRLRGARRSGADRQAPRNRAA